jgi:glyoxylase-like metal-dependent hydrolase (beta-lactamase superfamily II)
VVGVPGGLAQLIATPGHTGEHSVVRAPRRIRAAGGCSPAGR